MTIIPSEHLFPILDAYAGHRDMYCEWGEGAGAGEDDGCPRSDSWTIYLVHEYYNGRITFVCLSVGIIGMQ